MKTSTLLIGFIALALSACTTGKQESKSGEEASMSIVNAEAPESRPAPTPLEEVRAANDAFVDAFERGDFARAVEHYEEDAVWFLTNGMALRGRASIKGMLTKAHADGAGRFRFSELSLRQVADVLYTIESFSFEFTPGKAVEGTRFAVWATRPGRAPSLVSEAWVSSADAGGEMQAVISKQLEVVASAYNGDDAKALGALYTEDASMVLTNGKRVLPEAMNAMLDDTARMPIDDMRFGEPVMVYNAGETHLYARAPFDVTLPLPDGPVPLVGERLILWRQVGGDWKMVFEMSWPGNVPVETSR
jgi:ketosteroid isomerase-like protein